ncbi:MAG: sensor histidine kinase [Elusimicrobiota bacterium]
MGFIESVISFLVSFFVKCKEGLHKLTKKLEKNFSRLKIPLRSKLVILFVIAAAPAITFMILSSGSFRRAASAQAGVYVQSGVEAISGMAEQYLLNCRRALMSLGSEPRFRSLVRNNDYDALSREARRVYERFELFSFVGVSFRSGEKIFIPSVYPGNYSDVVDNQEIHDYLKWNFHHPDTRISGVYRHGGKNKVLVLHPVPGAVILGGVDLDSIKDMVEKAMPFEESSLFILDEEGSVVLGSEEIKKADFKGDSGFLELKDSGLIAHHFWSSALNWRVGVLTPASVLYRRTRNMRWYVMLFALLALGLCIGLAFYFSRMIIYPVSRLNRGAKILGKGKLNYRIYLETGDELEALAGEFNKMASKLEKSYDSLGDKIKKATGDLEKALQEIEQKNIEIKNADKMKSEFLASMSHELRTPINAVIGFTSLMEEETYGKITKRQKDTLEKVQRNTEHLLNLINDILDLSKIEAGKMDLVPEEFLLNTLLTQIREEVRPLVDQKNLEFAIETKEDIVCFNDYTRVRQILMNLISNAVKFTPEGKITLRAYKTGKENFAVEVQDTGIGIKEEDLDKIFSEFVQSDSSPSRQFGGTGLGLSICLKLISMMGGTIEASSKWKEGSVFKISVPLSIES